ncbi:alpha/beta fold hydrolase [Bradyrhizobium sp. 2TAF24]|uniref:alpha/beta fold hydrolase n=1 Tax=Bradyrhizobium sp. 2TAF24 TaxID=3233011 RepID=UPI003F8EFE62
MSTADRSRGDTGEAIFEQASRHTLALNPLVSLRSEDLLQSAGILLKAMVNEPKVASEQWMSFLGELGEVMGGRSERQPEAGDKRFADPTWANSGVHSRLLKAYLAWGHALDTFVDRTSLGDVDKQRAHLITTIWIDALAPTNSLLANPTAVRKLLDTGGQSVWQGFQHFLEDVTKHGGLPSQVDRSAFKVGVDLAATPGAVVFRNEILELVQYTPTTAKVWRRPLVITPPQINKYYAVDLSPDKSMVRFLLDSGIQTFCISWRNPDVSHRDWGLDSYVAAIDEAVDAVRDITGCDDISMMGSCSGGITSSSYFATLGAAQHKIRNMILAVCILDFGTFGESSFGSLITPETMAAAKASSNLRGVLDGDDLARMFAWMRPNDLIWNYWVNNYLLGNPPPAFDILFWNADTTRLPARLHGDYIDLYSSNPFVKPGTLKLNDTAVDLRAVKADSYVIAGVTDHITPWKSVYQTALLMGHDTTFVLANSGHLQSLINPPTNKKASYMIGAVDPAGPDAFLNRAEKRQGSWWLDWREWLHQRSDGEVDAPPVLGSTRHPRLMDAPGSYVFEQ